MLGHAIKNINPPSHRDGEDEVSRFPVFSIMLDCDPLALCPQKLEGSLLSWAPALPILYHSDSTVPGGGSARNAKPMGQ